MGLYKTLEYDTTMTATESIPIQGIIKIVDPEKIQHLDKTVDKEE